MTLRTLYRFIDEGQLPAYKMGRVIRLQAHEVDAFISRARIVPGTLEHLYPDPRGLRQAEARTTTRWGRATLRASSAPRRAEAVDLGRQGEEGQ